MKASMLAIFVAAAAAQGTTTTAALTPQQSCLSQCVPSDVNCQAICVGVPHPGEAQMGLVTDCVAACDQGDGSTAASEAYGRCRDSCLNSYIILSGTAAPGGAYTTAIPPGVSATAAAADASASADSAGRMTVATFLIPVDHSIARLYHPRWSYVTVEVYPYPRHVLERLGCDDCDPIVTLSYGQEFSYLPTPYHACPACPTAAPTHPGHGNPSSSWSRPAIRSNSSSVVAPKPTGQPSSAPKSSGPPSSAPKPPAPTSSSAPKSPVPSSSSVPKPTGPPYGAPVPSGKPANSTAAPADFPSGSPTGSPAGPPATWANGRSVNNERPHIVTIRTTEMINGKPCAVTMTMEDHQTKVMGSAVCGMTSFMKTYNMGDITGSIIHAPAVAVTGSTPVQQSEGVFNLHTMAHAKGQDEGPASGHAGASSSASSGASAAASSASESASAAAASGSSTANAAISSATAQYGGIFGMFLGALALL